jgi:pimeloyl-ACP methyl ester carboxylesterase
MRRRAAKNALAGALASLVLSLAGAALSVATAGAVAFTPCPGQPGFFCATLPVPLDRSAAVPGSISLHVERLLAGGAPSASAVVALAGGPGQAALPLGGDLAQAIAPALRNRDLIVFDQRGTGQSGALGCSALGGSGFSVSQLQGQLERCALQLGPTRGGYTTAESIQDIEAIREALGYEHLVLYGTSYGTKVALDYAARYPQHTEALVLDSVVPPNGPEPFELATFGAITPVLHELCAHHACKGITGSPVGDLARLAKRLRTHALRGSIDDGYGHAHVTSMGALELLFVLEAGDLNPALRALLPAAVQSALRGDAAPLLQLSELSQGLIPNVPPIPREHAEEGVDETLFWTTSCEEDPFPWQRSGTAATRRAEALAALAAIPSGQFYPFEPGVGLLAGPMLDCLRWPAASAPPAAGATAPPAAGPTAAVPTLILSGGQDLRTPTAQARKVAATIPGAQLQVVPYTGHSVLGSDLSGCADAAVQRFFDGQHVQPCVTGINLFSPTPVTPTRLATVAATPGLGGKAGRTVTAVLDSILDLDRLIVAATLQAEQELPSGSRFGGLRGGYAAITSSSVRLVHFSFVRGVALTGTWPIIHGRLLIRPLRVEGNEAAHGTVLLHSDHRVSGTLAGTSFEVAVSGAVLARAGSRRATDHTLASVWSGSWPLSPSGLPGSLVSSRSALGHIR